jgi:hypothetical protein
VFKWFSTLRSASRRSTPRRLGLASQLSCESLEDRTTPTVSTITSNFNGTAIPAGDYIWFSSVGKVSGVGADPVTLNITHQTITFNGTTIDLPDTTLTLTPGATTASTSFGSGGWSVSTPASFSGNVFLGGIGWQVLTGGIAGGSVKSITWSGDFTTNTPGIGVNWQWAAAVYTSFTADESALQIKTVDDNHVDTYKNSDHAGTPENFKSDVTGGARGGGGSNWTGSLSGTASIKPEVAPPPSQGTGMISGAVTFSQNSTEMSGPVTDATVTLTDSLGNSTTIPVGKDGSYSFGSLAAGTYTITVVSPAFGQQSATITLTDGEPPVTQNFNFSV